MWKKCIKQISENNSLLVVKDYHLLRGLRIIIQEKLSSRELFIANFCNGSSAYLTKIL